MKIDLNRVPIMALCKFYNGKMQIQDILELLNYAVEGGVMSLPVTELPSLMSQFIEEWIKNNETISIAIGSMKLHLEENEEDE